MDEKPKLITAAEAQARLGITKVKMARLLKEGHFTIYTNPLDRRQKLIDEAELEEAVRPAPIVPRRRAAGGPEGKAAA